MVNSTVKYISKEIQKLQSVVHETLLWLCVRESRAAIKLQETTSDLFTCYMNCYNEGKLMLEPCQVFNAP